MQNEKLKNDNPNTSSPPFISGFDNNKGKKLKREDYLDLSDEEFEMIQTLNDMPGEGPNAG